MSAPLTAARLRPQLEEVRRRRPREPVVGVHHDGPWAGPEQVMVAGDVVPVRVCASTLAVREALVEAEERGGGLVVVTAEEERELGEDLMARLAGQALVRPNLARAVLGLFGAHDLDRRVARQPWLLEALVESAPPDGYDPAPGGALDADRAWRALLRHRLDLQQDRPDALELLRWLGEAGRAAALRELGDELREALAQRLEAVPGARPIIAAALAGHEERLVALGLVARLLVDPPEAARDEALAAAARLEAYLGGEALDLERDAPAWAMAAEQALRERAEGGGPGAAAPWQSEAGRLVEALRLPAAATAASDVLAAGFTARAGAVNDALLAVVKAPGPTGCAALEAAIARLGVHAVTASRSGLRDGLLMVERLARWLGEAEAEDPSTLADQAAHEQREGAWVDWARDRVADAEVAELGPGLRALAGAVDEHRREAAQPFARAAVAWPGLTGAGAQGVLGVEDVLDHVVAPVARAAPTLAIVLDGLSGAVARELLADLAWQGWLERAPAALGGGRPLVLAALPSVTAVSRCSLLSGRLQRGDARVETHAFAAHPALREAGTAEGEPLLIHKRDLLAPTGGLADDLRGEVLGRRRVVGVVVNAIDDWLSGSDQHRPRWSPADIRPLGWLLDAAREAGRAVVLLSDHGHVVHRDGERRPVAEGEHGDRWRTGSTAAAGEVTVDGPRLVADRRPLVLAWDPRVRYGAPHVGYHGGAGPQELLAPAIVLSADPAPLEGLVDLAPDEPAWWRGGAPGEPLTPLEARARRPSKGARAGQLALGVGEPTEATVAPSPAPAWLDALLASPTFAAQRERAPRTGVPDERVRVVLGALGRHGGRLTLGALAAEAAIPPARLTGTLAALRPLLNLDGYGVLTVDVDADAVTVDVDLLREQFGL